jgi:hypothetical protein
VGPGVRGLRSRNRSVVDLLLLTQPNSAGDRVDRRSSALNWTAARAGWPGCSGCRHGAGPVSEAWQLLDAKSGRKCVKDPLGVFSDPFTSLILAPSGGLPQPLLRIRNEFTAGSGQRETRLELATSSLEGIFTNPNSESPDGHAGARYFSS